MGTDHIVDERTVEVSGAPIFYRRAPASGTPALYLHSVPTSSDDWLAMLARTGGVAPDLPGFGRSTKATGVDYSLTAYADFVEALVDALELEPLTIVGHGWGAAIGLVYAQRHPDHVVRLAIIDAIPLTEAFRWPSIARQWRRLGVGELVMGSVGRWLLARILRAGSSSPQAWPEARIDAVWEQFDQGTQRAILRLHRSAGPQALAAAGAGLENLRQPVLVLWGERDPWLAPGYAAEYARRLPGATLEIVAGAGHWPWLDDPAVLDRLAAFVSP
ncbi:MAG: alpha/beta fold hydrolase [Solirubrobacteraceae bacterium]